MQPKFTFSTPDASEVVKKLRAYKDSNHKITEITIILVILLQYNITI